MAIFSLSHHAIGRSTHKAGTAGAHASYVLRATAATATIGEHMPTGRTAARRWLDEQEAADRKNARVIDKLMVALPRELTPAQRQDLVRAFVRSMTGGRVPWLAAFHDGPKDAHNPHAHIILRDRDAVTGKRVVKFSERDSTAKARAIWERHVNQALHALGHAARVSRLSLAAQGIERTPQRHQNPLNRRVRTYGFFPLRSKNPRAPAPSACGVRL